MIALRGGQISRDRKPITRGGGWSRIILQKLQKETCAGHDLGPYAYRILQRVHEP